MKKLWTVLIMLCFLVMLPLQSLGASAVAPKISVKHYKTEQIQYAVIHGDKYKAVNAKMLNEAKETYALQKELDQQLARDKANGSVPDYMEYWAVLTPFVKYKSSTKVSILTQLYVYNGGAHGNSSYESYNVYKGTQLSLKGAFKSEAAYLKAKKYAKAKMLGYPEKYPFADSTTTIAGHPYYWVAPGGIKVVFAPYEVAPYAAGPVTVSIPAAYMMK